MTYDEHNIERGIRPPEEVTGRPQTLEIALENLEGVVKRYYQEAESEHKVPNGQVIAHGIEHTPQNVADMGQYARRIAGSAEDIAQQAERLKIEKGFYDQEAA